MGQSIALVFPGQGSQYVGMGKALYEAFSEAREVFHHVNDALNMSLSSLMFQGPVETLNQTQYTQPALMSVSMAMMAVLKGQKILDIQNAKIAVLAGHSLGEYSALCAAESWDVATTARILQKRGQAMQEASTRTCGGMLAVLGGDIKAIEALIQGSQVSIAAYNSPGQIVLSGLKDQLESFMPRLTALGVKRCVFLPVSGGFHSMLMEHAAQVLESSLKDNAPLHPIKPLILNTTADLCQDSKVIGQQLVRAITQPVRWTQSVERMVKLGVTMVVEIGAGKVLSQLVQRTHAPLKVVSLQGPEDIEKYVQES